MFNYYTNYHKKNLLEPKSIHGDQVLLKNHLVTISKLSHENNTYIFPRNGFLLGVIRHKGFLPNEGIDPDLACLEKDIPKILESDWGDYTISAITNPESWIDKDFFDGKHPLTRKKFKYYYLVIKHKKSNFKENCMIFYELDKDNYYYPWLSNKNTNSDNEFKLDVNSYSKGDGGAKIIYKNTIIPLQNLYNNKEYLGKTGYLYKKIYFDNFYLEKFYDKGIYVPKGSKNLLKSQYGNDVFDVMIKKDGSRISINFF